MHTYCWGAAAACARGSELLGHCSTWCTREIAPATQCLWCCPLLTALANHPGCGAAARPTAANAGALQRPSFPATESERRSGLAPPSARGCAGWSAGSARCAAGIAAGDVCGLRGSGCLLPSISLLRLVVLVWRPAARLSAAAAAAAVGAP
jgi:hypothetical protein